MVKQTHSPQPKSQSKPPRQAPPPIVLILASSLLIFGVVRVIARSPEPSPTDTPAQQFSDISVPNGTVRYGGSTSWAALRGSIEPAIEQEFPQLQLTYKNPADQLPSTEAGITMLLNGQLDFAQSSKGIPPQLMEQAKAQGVNLKAVPVAIDSIAVVVHPSLPIEGLTLDQFKGIQQGHIRNWKEIGGPDLPITAYSQDGHTQLPGSKQANAQSATQPQNVATEALRQVANDPGGIYWHSATIVVPQCGVKPLMLGESPDRWVAPYQLPLIPAAECSAQNRNRVNVEAMRTRTYPEIRELSVIIKENGGFEQQAGEAYANLLLTEAGQDLIRAAGYLNITD